LIERIAVSPEKNIQRIGMLCEIIRPRTPAFWKALLTFGSLLKVVGYKPLAGKNLNAIAFLQTV